MLLANWTHNLSPFLWEFSPGVGVRWYGLAYVAGFVLAYFLFLRWSRGGWLPLKGKEVGDFLTWVVVGVVVGGRLGYCLFYSAERWVADPLYVFRVWEGGMSSHGGILGLFVGIWGYALRHRADGWRLADAVALAAPWGVVLGRLANFVNGELWGRPSDLPWAVIFPASGDLLARHPYAIYAALMEGAAVGVFALVTKKLCKRSGVVLGAAILAYAVMRILSEFFREPDGGRFWLFGMTQGQWLSVFFILGGAVVLVVRLNKKAEATDE